MENMVPSLIISRINPPKKEYEKGCAGLLEKGGGEKTHGPAISKKKTAR